ncbi:probable polygalacturonase [Daucus carota subsp. sativus]|uniref:Pectate lyase superfamily protein domain-containing protein n=1 Tax=Daucus carota subsp. sativus TaxID=79200 RepID=A0A166HG28_DAUCS|nr:PREDICTED: probable polygalacturonase [Daucus carota subsp. sativus]
MARGDKRIMKRLVTLILIVSLSHVVQHCAADNIGQCKSNGPLKPRPHSVSILEFGAVGDGKTLNTIAFQNAIFYLKSFADKGGAQLYVPSGKWLTGSFNLTSHLTLFLEKEATILGSQDIAHWEVVDALPSYGLGIELSGGRYRSLITGNNLVDVVITGDNGTIDGQGSVWWEQFSSHSLNYSRPHLVEFISSKDVVVSNLTFLNSPSYNIHPVYCSNVLVQNVTAYALPESPSTSGIVPDSSEYVCIENSNISVSYDAIVLKSGWDEYGIALGKPTTDVHIRDVRLQSTTGAGLAFGSEMSGGISSVLVEKLDLHDSFIGIEFKTSIGRGGFIEDIYISDAKIKDVKTAILATGQSESHPDDSYDPHALPVVKGITFKDIVGKNVTIAGNFSGIPESPFTSICLSNISFTTTTYASASWLCSDVSGASENVNPDPCPALQNSYSSPSSVCSLLFYPSSHAAVL